MAGYTTVEAKIIVRPTIYTELAKVEKGELDYSKLTSAVASLYGTNADNLGEAFNNAQSVMVKCVKGTVLISLVYGYGDDDMAANVTEALKGIAVGYLMRVHESNEEYWANDTFEVSEGFTEILIKEDDIPYNPLDEETLDDIYPDRMYPVKTSCGQNIMVEYNSGYFASPDKQ